MRLFLERGFGAVSMDELAEAAGVARRTLYNQFTSKEEIFREMLLRVSGQLEDAFPPGIETQGDVGEVLRLVARMILELHRHPEYPGFLRMVVADARQFPWIAEEFAAVMEPQTERLARYIAPPDSRSPDRRDRGRDNSDVPPALQASPAEGAHMTIPHRRERLVRVDFFVAPDNSVT